MHRLLWKLSVVTMLTSGAGLLASMGSGCGSESSVTIDQDASIDATGGGACLQTGSACTNSADCCSVDCDPTSKTCSAPRGGTSACKVSGDGCAVSTECCNLVCSAGKCGASLCTSDNQACTSDAECCGGVCGGGDGGARTCTPLSTTCKTSGNRCAGDGECCAKLCTSGVCNAHPSFCTQLGDVCAADGECCTGLCTKAAGATLGLCAIATAPGVPGCTPAGQICSSATTGDGGAGVSICGGDCCSRSCRPYAPTGVNICQPPSGCHPTGELCLTDNDCCGAPGMPGSTKLEGGNGQTTDVHCAKAPGAAIGQCDNGKACSPAGSICRLSTNSCNATNRCCSGTVQQHPLNCKQDTLGIPRCTAAPDVDCKAGPIPPAGTACASSADCCDKPCVPNPAGTPAFVCGATACVPTTGACTTTADCCTGSPCNHPTGSSKGTCGPTTGGGPGPGTDAGTGGTDAGPPACGQYGQVCTTSGDCCAGTECLGGRCGVVLK